MRRDRLLQLIIDLIGPVMIGSPDGGHHAELPGDGSTNEEVSALNLADACCFGDIEWTWSTRVSGCKKKSTLTRFFTSGRFLLSAAD
jgi:N6-adenosine-specific RNA methylase IME4